ncbi:MAG TPA: proton-conducting transporter membrane subunit [Verrucomicrobiae bacterium]|nr:proton-conducting transporter membrane subunit [Verrucomicrobiae bacterium]
MAWLLIIVPLLVAAMAAVAPSNRWRPWLVPLGGLAHLALVIAALRGGPVFALQGWLVLDPLGKLVLGFISVLFFLCALYAPGYLALRSDRPNRVFCSCLMVMLAMMTLVTLSHQLGLMWVAMEATTLATAPLLFFNHNPRSLEATWKYLLIASVGTALALLGSFFLAYSSLREGLTSTLLFDDLVNLAPQLSRPWLHTAFVLLLVGYGTKMGLAPMHTWKPDAYGEAPGLVGALLAGGVTSCAFLAILRFHRICVAAQEDAFARQILVFVGLLSMTVAAVFMVRQRDFKRMLAYSSVEHMGILAFGVGVGGLATFGALLHLLTNGLTKGALFLSAGNIHRAYGSKLTDEVRGANRRLPVSGPLFLIGFLAITGSPPGGPFRSEFTILSGTIGAGRFIVAAMFLLLLGAVFVGMGATVLRVVQGAPSARAEATQYRDHLQVVAPILAFLGLVLLLGVYIPAPLESLLRNAVSFVEGAR